MQLLLTLQHRQALILDLGLESEFFESVLVRSEQLLKLRRNQRGLRLLKHLNRDEYHSVLDWLLGVLAPSWRLAIGAFYAGEGPKLAKMVEWDTIDAIDQAMAQVIIELAAAYRALEQDGWTRRGTDPDDLTCTMACEAIRFLLPPVPGFTPAEAAA